MATTRARLAGGGGAGIGALMLAVYVIFVMNEGVDTFWQVAPWAAGMGATSAAAASVSRPTTSPAVRGRRG